MSVKYYVFIEMINLEKVILNKPKL